MARFTNELRLDSPKGYGLSPKGYDWIQQRVITAGHGWIRQMITGIAGHRRVMVGFAKRGMAGR